MIMKMMKINQRVSPKRYHLISNNNKSIFAVIILTMEVFEQINNTGFFMYTKSHCIICDQIKSLLSENNILYNTVLCDTLLENSLIKEDFFKYIKDKCNNKPIRSFPIIFYNGKYMSPADACEKIDELSMDTSTTDF